MKTCIKQNPWFPNNLEAGSQRIRWKALACIVGLLVGVLTAQAQDPYLTSVLYPMSTNASLGATVSFQVYASTTRWPLTYQWQHEGTNLPAGTKNPLVLTNLTLADAGSYVAWVTNAVGSFTNSRAAMLTVDTMFTKINQGPPATDTGGSTTVTWIDYDQDGWLDLFVGNAGSGSVVNSLYRNNGDRTFTRITTNLLGSVPGNAMGVAWGDYDNDGRADLFVANAQNLLPNVFRNEGGGRFSRVTTGALVSTAFEGLIPLWGDYDNDGFVDLFLSTGFGSPQIDRLFHNEGNGRFRIVTEAEAGTLVTEIARDQAFGWNDYDNDGDLNLFLVYGGQTLDGPGANYVFRTSLSGPFEKTALTNFNIARLHWGSTWGDYDNDGYLDVFLPSLYYTNALFRNLQGQGFTNVSATAGLELAMGSNGSAWGDYDNDGWLDLCVANYEGQASYPGGQALFHNNRDGTFTRITTGSPAHDGGRAIAVAWGDYDNDGFLDLYIACGDGSPQRNLFYRNNGPGNGNTNRWLKVKLTGQASNRMGIGAKIKVLATIGGQGVSQMRTITGQHSWIGDNGLLAHFGLGDATQVMTLRIEWPSGIVQELQNVAADQFLTVVESQGYGGAAPQFNGVTSDATGRQLSFTEPDVDARYVLEASTDLTHWTKLLARTSTGVTTNFTDIASTNHPQRFYRLQVP